jgi:hypothetical protein
MRNYSFKNKLEDSFITQVSSLFTITSILILFLHLENNFKPTEKVPNIVQRTVYHFPKFLNFYITIAILFFVSLSIIYLSPVYLSIYHLFPYEPFE